MVQYAESMVKLDENAVFWLKCVRKNNKKNNKAKLRSALYVRKQRDVQRGR
jgi:hypothetical protein